MTVSIAHRIHRRIDRRVGVHSTRHRVHPAARTRHVPRMRREAEVRIGTWLMIHEAQRPLQDQPAGNGYGLLLKDTDQQRATLGSSA